jgi:hypothetical protein
MMILQLTATATTASTTNNINNNNSSDLGGLCIHVGVFKKTYLRKCLLSDFAVQV